MLDLLSDYLNHATTPEEKHVIANALEALDEVGKDNYEYGIEEILNTDDEVDAGSTMQSITDLIRGQLYQVMRDFGITLSEDCNLQLLGDIVRGMTVLSNYDRPRELVDATNSQARVREVFCEIMAMVTKYSVEDLLPFVEEVPDGFLARLKHNEDAEAADEGPDLDERRERIHAYHKYEIYLTNEGGAPAYLTNMLRSGVGVSLPFILYAKSMTIPFELLSPKAIAREMFGMALVSSDGYDRPSDTVKAHIEEFITSPEVIVAVMAEVRALVLGYQS